MIKGKLYDDLVELTREGKDPSFLAITEPIFLGWYKWILIDIRKDLRGKPLRTGVTFGAKRTEKRINRFRELAQQGLL